VPAPIPSRAESRDPLRILVLDEEIPYPLDSGKRIRTWNILSRLAGRHRVTLVCYGEPTGTGAGVLRDAGIELRAVRPLKERRGVALYAQLLLNLASPYPYSVTKHHTKRFDDCVQRLIKTGQFDIVHCEWTPYARYLKDQSQLPVLIATHNIESQIWERRADHNGTALGKLFFHLQAVKMRRFEQRALHKADWITVVSRPDAATAKSWQCPHITLVPNGVDLEQFKPANCEASGGELLFLGSLDWFPNWDGLEYFVAEIWPIIRLAKPNLKLLVVGRRPPAVKVRKLESEPGIEVVGEVPDVRPYLARSELLVVPLRIGGGSRIKILEALAAGTAVVTTSVGVEGLDLEDGVHLAVADNPSVFAGRILQLLASPDERHRIAFAGRQAVVDSYSWDAAANQLESAWYEVMKSVDHRCRQTSL
jgi:polysaccharide biosynthesis protein PslH